MWVEIVSALLPQARFASAAQAQLFADIERELGQSLPADLRDLLLESNGIQGEYSVNVIWPAERILEDNRAFRANPSFAELYEPFDDLIFFGDNGGGDQFAFAADPSIPGILVWEHEDDTRRVVADDLADYLRRCLPSDGDEWYVDYES